MGNEGDVIKYVATATTSSETVHVKNTTSFVGLQRFRQIKLGRLNLRTLLLSFLYITPHNSNVVTVLIDSSVPKNRIVLALRNLNQTIEIWVIGRRH